MPTLHLAFDADDTLWDNEGLFIAAQGRFAELLAHYHPAEWVKERLYETELRNLQHFGYGIKAFTLSMIETAIELTEGRIAGPDIQVLVDMARSMLTAEVTLCPHAAEAVADLATTHSLIIITKGDPFDQEAKVARSGLAQYFQHIEVVSDKTPEVYARLLRRHGVPPESFLMVGNSLRSDILPVLALGGRAVYVPYAHTWTHEVGVEPVQGRPGYYEVAHLGELPALIAKIETSSV